ncbi:MAG: hypothetical protein CMO44_11040 [Verrucomicrobiales bacterium]|nr:hypothetical protein [Verrucomicrobiales bacterium]|tara:strand:- start:748 stop:1062 length:315 start_codon:yes stop_codon:yes gene_type:complete
MSTIGVKKLQYPDGGVASITLDSSGAITFGGQLSGTITADTITAGKFSTINTKTTVTEPIQVTAKNITANVTIDSNSNALMIGPMTVDSGVILTVLSGGTLTTI